MVCYVSNTVPIIRFMLFVGCLLVSAPWIMPLVSTLTFNILPILHLCTENLYRPLVVPPIKALCYAAIVDLFRYLPQSKANPQAVDVRQKLQLASWMSLWPTKFEKYRLVLRAVVEILQTNFLLSALGLSHALGHKLGAAYGIPHGITSVRLQ